MLVYENHSCIRADDCSLDKNSLIKGYKQLGDRLCVRECPVGYKIVNDSVRSRAGSNESVLVEKCVPCVDGICKKNCSDKSFVLKTNADIELIKNCFVVKRLVVELEGSNSFNITTSYLAENIQYLEEINDYLLITRNRYLVSLSFFKNLKVIHGRALFEKRFALFVHTNSKLNELWNVKKANGFTITSGAVKFFENPQLCYQNIENFMQDSQVDKPLDAEISFNFNGYKRLTCSSNYTIDLTFKLDPSKITVEWTVTISDLRRLKGYILSYMDVSSSDVSSVDIENLDYDWTSLYIEFGESMKSSRKMFATLDVEPFTRYAVYLKADLTLDVNWNSEMASSFERDRLTSNLNYVYSLPARMISAFFNFNH
jgi:insulin receptor